MVRRCRRSGGGYHHARQHDRGRHARSRPPDRRAARSSKFPGNVTKESVSRLKEYRSGRRVLRRAHPFRAHIGRIVKESPSRPLKGAPPLCAAAVYREQKTQRGAYMTGEERRRAISGLIGSSPRTASGLAELFGVSPPGDRAGRRAPARRRRKDHSRHQPRLRSSENPSRASPACSKCGIPTPQAREELYHHRRMQGGRVEDVYVHGTRYTARSARHMGIDTRRKAEAFVQADRRGGGSAPSQKHHRRLPLPHRSARRARPMLDAIAAETARARIFRCPRKERAGRKREGRSFRKKSAFCKAIA